MTSVGHSHVSPASSHPSPVAAFMECARMAMTAGEREARAVFQIFEYIKFEFEVLFLFDRKRAPRLQNGIPFGPDRTVCTPFGPDLIGLCCRVRERYTFRADRTVFKGYVRRIRIFMFERFLNTKKEKKIVPPKARVDQWAQFFWSKCLRYEVR